MDRSRRGYVAGNAVATRVEAQVPYDYTVATGIRDDGAGRPGRDRCDPPDQFGLWGVPGSLVELKTAGDTGIKLTALEAVPFMTASGGSCTFSLIIVPLVKVVELPGETDCCDVVKVAASGTDCGLPLALSVIVSIPGSVPATVGLNVTLMEQLACGGRVAEGIGHVFVCA